MQRTKTLAYETKIPGAGADKPDSVAPASGIRLVRPPLATLPGASSVPPPPSSRPLAQLSTAAPAVRPVARTLPLVVAPVPVPNAKSAAPEAKPALPKALATAKALVSPSRAGSPRTMVPPPPPSGPRARGLSSAPPPPSKRPPRPEPQMLDDDSVVDDEAVIAAASDDLIEVEAIEIAPPPRSSAPPRASSAPRKLPSLRATGQNWPKVEWPRLDGSAPRPASVRPSAPPRPASSPPPPMVEAVALAPVVEAEPAADAIQDAVALAPEPAAAGPALEPTPIPSDVEAADLRLDEVVAPAPQMLPPPPPPANDDARDVPSAIVFSDEDEPIDFRPESPIVRLRAALGQVGPIVAWLDRNPRAFASVGFGAGVVVALFVALVVQ